MAWNRWNRSTGGVARGDRLLFVPLGAALLVWAWVCAPMLFGERTFYVRDVFLTHLPLKAFGAEQLKLGRVPAFDPDLNLGQVFRGNPNAVAFYPGNVLYLLLPFWVAFNLHYALHWLLGFFTMAALARRLGQGRAAAAFAGITYAGSAWMLSALTFYNLLTVAAWWPLVLLGAVRGDRRGIAIGGLACGMALLGGEPVTAALGLVPLALIAVAALGWRRGALAAAAIGVVGMLVALPQVVAMLRVAGFTVRVANGMTAEQVAGFSLHPLRLIELALPLPFGWPGYLGPHRLWAGSILERAPLFFSLYAGIIALWLAFAAVRRQRVWTLLAISGPLLAIAGGLQGELLRSATFGLFRHPEKFLFWLALALPILAGFGIERALGVGGLGAWRRVAWVIGALFLLVGGVLALSLPALRDAALPRLPADPKLREAAVDLLVTQVRSWAEMLGIAGSLLILGALCAREAVAPRWRAAGLAVLQFVALLQLWPLVFTESLAPYRAAGEWSQALPPRAAVLRETKAVPPWLPVAKYDLPAGPPAEFDRMGVADLDVAPNALFGLRYPLAPDLDGMQSPLFARLEAALPGLSWPQRVPWLRSLGLDAMVLAEAPKAAGLRQVAEAKRFGVPTYLYVVEQSAPEAWWPRTVRAVSGPDEALAAVTTSADPIAEVAAPAMVHDPEGTVRLIASSPDRIELEVESRGGGLAVVRRAFHPLFVASAENQPLRTVAVNLNLLGVVVPPGRHRVVLAVSAWPEITASLVALLAGIAALRVLRRSRERDSAA